MYNTSLRIVGDTQEAEDIIQESFLDAFRRLDSYSGQGSFGSWLKRIVTNNSLDALRKRKEMISMDEQELDFPDIVEENLDQDMELQIADVKEAITQLPEPYRIVLTLFLFEGYDHEEIGEILGVSNNVSRTRFVRAKQKIMKYIREKKIRQSFIFN